ncbi:MAG: hypothetical protein JSS81_15745 [Acidobacteria bacterium]|nr:hypothetical protein [Acidobacteriota bacterium]
MFIVLLGASGLAARAQTGAIDCALDLSDRLLEVRIGVPAGGLDKTSFSLTDWAGQPNYADNVYRVAARDRDGRVLKVEKTGPRTWVVENAKKAFELGYTVVSQKEIFMGGRTRNHFHPTLFKDYAFLWGSTFLMFPDAEELLARPVNLKIDAHEYGAYYTNFANRADRFDDLSELFVAAGNYRVVPKTIGGRNVRFLLEGGAWKFTDEEFTGAVSRIIEAQIGYLGFTPSKDDLLITLTEGTPNSKGGTVVKNVISVYPDPQAGLDDFETLKLISHEHFHFWNGNYWHEAEGKKEGYYKWMSEGFTEYYAGLTLYRENLIPEKRFVAWLNELLFQYQTNPYAETATAAVLGEKYWESNDYNRLPYVKGALIGFLTDLRIRKESGGKKQIDDLMKLLIEKTDRSKGYDDRLLLAGFDAVSGADSRRFFDDYALGAKFLPVVEVLGAASIAVAKRPRDVFALGFTTEDGQMARGARIREVTTPAAVKAGLRPGDELRGFSFEGGRPNSEASFTVRRGDETLTVKYYPKHPIEVLQIDENARIPI